MSHIIAEDFPEILPEKQYPKDQRICSIKQWKQNWKCIVLTVSIILSMMSAYWCHQEISSQGISKKEIRFNENTRWVLILSTIILYSLYLMECSHATDGMQLCGSRVENIQTIIDKIDDMKNALPVIWWKAICYHYERRKRRTTQYRRGTYFVATRIYQERVNTVSASSSFNYTCCGQKDISNSLIINRNCRQIIKFRFSKGFAFANMPAATEFEAQRSAFFQELQRYDEYMEVHEGLDLTDYASFQEEKIVLNTANRKRPWFANPIYYWLFSCLLLSYPFRIILLYNTTHVHYKITKLFGTNYNNNNLSEPSSSDYNLYRLPPYRQDDDDDDDELTPLSAAGVVNDQDSADLLGGSTNLIIAPSYSEAMLLDDNNNNNNNHTRSTTTTTIGIGVGRIISPREYSSSIASIDGSSSSKIVNNFNNASSSSNSSSDDIVVAAAADGLATDTPPKDTTRSPPPVSAAAPRLARRRSCSIAAMIIDDQHQPPPSYEDALMLPLVMQHHGSAAAITRESEFTTTEADNNAVAVGCSSLISRNNTPSHNPYDIRLPNCRTFLSIETSL